MNSTQSRVLGYLKLRFRRLFQLRISLSASIAFGFLAFASVSFLPLISSPAQAAVTIPQKINFQGRLTDAAGNIKPNGLYNIKFRIMTAPSGGSNVFAEDRIITGTDNRIQITNGLFNIQFGDVTSLSGVDFTQTALYLEVELPTPATATCATNGCAVFTEGAMTPRQPLAAAPYAFNADKLDGVDGASYARQDISNSFTAANTFTGSGNGTTVAGTLFKNTTDSTTAFQIQNAAGTSNLFNADTTNTRIGIGTATPSTRLSLGGTGAANGIVLGDDAANPVGIYRGGSDILKTDDNVLLAGPGGANSQFKVQTSVGDQLFEAYSSSSYATAAIGGGTSSQIHSELRFREDGATAFGLGTDDVGLGGTNGLYLYNYNQNAYVLGVSTSGAATFKNSTDSTRAFQVQNATAASLLAADTTNMRIGVGPVGGFSDTSTKLADPATLPTGTGNGTAFSADGTYMTVAHATTPFMTIYKRSGDTFTKLTNPATLPTSTANAVAFSPDGTYMTIGQDTSPYIHIYKIDKATDTFTKLTNPASLPAGSSYGVSFSPDGSYMSVAHGTTPFVTIYKVNKTTDTFTKLTNPATLPTGLGIGTAFSPDGTYMTVAHSTTPFITIYKRSGDTFTKLTNPATLPTGQGFGTTFSPDGNYMSVGSNATPFILIYKRSGDTFTKLTDPATLPTGTGYGATFSPDGTYLNVSHAVTPFTTTYKRSGDTFTKLTNPATLPASSGFGTAFSADGTYMTVAHSTTPFVTIYKGTGGLISKVELAVSTLRSDGISFGKDLTVYRSAPNVLTLADGGSLTIPNGTLSVGTSVAEASLHVAGTALFRNTSDSITAFQVQNASAVSVFSVDTTNGRVGIGTSSPGVKLEVQAAATDAIRVLSGSSSSYTKLSLGRTATDADLCLAGAANDCITGTAAGDLTMRGITGSVFISDSGASVATLSVKGGKVGVGNAAPGGLLDVRTTAATSGIGIPIILQSQTGASSNAGGNLLLSSGANGSGAANGYIALGIGSGVVTTSGGSFSSGEAVRILSNGSVRFLNYGAGTLTTDASGNITAASDERLKDIQGSFSRGLDAIQSLNPIVYSWNGLSGLETNSTYAGFSAQNVQLAIPEAVGRDSRGYLTLQDRPILAASINAIKELDTRLAAIEVTTGNSSSFASLNVSGEATIQTLTVTGVATIATLTVAGNATFQGDIMVNGHIVTGGDAPTATVLPGAGSEAAVTVEGNDTAGTITITAGSGGGITLGEIATIIFSKPFGKPPKIVLSGQDEVSIDAKLFPFAKSTTDFTLKTSLALEPNTTYTFDYFIAE